LGALALAGAFPVKGGPWHEKGAREGGGGGGGVGGGRENVTRGKLGQS